MPSKWAILPPPIQPTPDRERPSNGREEAIMSTLNSRTVAILGLVAMASLGCEQATGTSASHPDAASDLGGLSGADAVFVADSATQTGTWQPPKPDFTCDPAAPTPWVDWTASHFFQLADPKAGTPPINPDCTDAVDKSCTTVCDCKFVFTHCGLQGANVAVPWSQWNPSTSNGKGGCMSAACSGTLVPEPGKNELACIKNKCYASGPNAKE